MRPISPVFVAALLLSLLSLGVPMPALAKSGTEELLTPCLEIAADGSAVYPTTTLPPSRHLHVVFQLKPDAKAKMLASRWIALDAGQQVVAENELDLKGQRSGWLRLVLQEPAPEGRYRLDALLDGKKWKSVEFSVAAPSGQAMAEKPTDLTPLVEGTTMTYDMTMRVGKGTKAEVPGMQFDDEGVARGRLVTTVGKTEPAGTSYMLKVNDQEVAQVWVRADEKGVYVVRRKNPDSEQPQDLNPPQMLQPLPPKLENGTEWTAPGHDGGELKLQLFGPVSVQGPDGPANGYVIFSSQEITEGSPGVPATRGKETIERHYLPKVGLVKEVRVATIGGKLASRQEVVLASNLAYKLVVNPKMKGRLGRVQFSYPANTNNSNARVAVYRSDGEGDKDKPVNSGYGEAGFDLMPGRYEAAVNNKRVPIEVKSGHDTIPRCGVLRVHATSETRFRIFDADGKTELHSGYGEQDVALPMGSYVLEIAGATEKITIADGQVVEF